MNKGVPVIDIPGHIPSMVGESVTYPEKGGVLVKIKGMNVPLKGLPFPQFIYAMDAYKRLIREFVQELLADKIFLILFLVRFWRWKRYLDMFGSISSAAVRHYKIEPKFFCDSGRELWRVGKDWGDWWYALCYIWENDNAYRTRGQFFFQILDIDALNKSPRKELQRVLRDMMSRDTNLTNKYPMLIKACWIVPLFNTKIKAFFNNLDLEQVRPDDIDKEWFKYSTHFNFF